MGDDNVSPTQNKIWPVLTGRLIAALLAKSCFLLRGGKAQVEASAKEKAKQKVFTERNTKDPPMHSCEARKTKSEMFGVFAGGFLHFTSKCAVLMEEGINKRVTYIRVSYGYCLCQYD